MNWAKLAEDRIEEAIAPGRVQGFATQLDRLRQQLQEKRVAFALAMERLRRREPHALD